MAILPKPRSLKSPAWRLEIALSLAPEDSSDDVYVEAIHSYIHGKSDSDDIAQAYLMYYLPQSRSILSSLLLAGADAPAVASYIRGTEESVIAFGKIFFDVSVFPNRLVLKDFIDSLPEDTSLTKNHKALLRSAYSLGDRYVAWKMSLSIEDSLDPDIVSDSLLEDSYWRSREHKPFAIDDSRAKESRSWIPQVLRTLESARGSREGGELALDSLRLKLVKVDTTLSKDSIAEEIKG